MYTISCPGRTSTKTSNSSRCTSSIVEKGLNLEGRVVANQRAEAQLSLLNDIEGELEAVEAVFYSHDVPWQFVGHEYVSVCRPDLAAADGEVENRFRRCCCSWGV